MGFFYVFQEVKEINFLKAFNNNVALVKGKSGIEWIVIGKGLAFQKKYGDVIDEQLVRKKFISDNIDQRISSEVILEKLTMDEFKITSEVVQLVVDNLNVEFSTSNYLLLAEHLHYAIERTETDNNFPEGHWELKHLYPKEFNMSLRIIEFLKSTYEIHLSDAELNYLTFHFVSAKSNWVYVSDTMDMTRMIKRIIEVIQYNFYKELDVNSSSYSRFLVHLRYFFLRHQENQQNTHPLNREIILIVKEKYPKYFDVCKKIAEYIQEEKGWILSEEEIVFLAFHIIRLMDDENNNTTLKN